MLCLDNLSYLTERLEPRCIELLEHLGSLSLSSPPPLNKPCASVVVGAPIFSFLFLLSGWDVSGLCAVDKVLLYSSSKKKPKSACLASATRQLQIVRQGFFVFGLLLIVLFLCFFIGAAFQRYGNVLLS